MTDYHSLDYQLYHLLLIMLLKTHWGGSRNGHLVGVRYPQVEHIVLALSREFI